MARPKNQLGTVQLRVSIPPELLDELEMLVATGFFGANVNEAINRLVSEGIRNAYLTGKEISQGRDSYNELIKKRGKRHG